MQTTNRFIYRQNGHPPNPLTKADQTDTHPNTTQNQNNNHTNTPLHRQLSTTQNRPTKQNNNKEEDNSHLTEGTNEEWRPPSANAQCIKIVVDNQTLADIVNGDAVLHNPKLIPAISRILDRFELWTAQGWHTPTAATPFVNWRYREYNKSADEMCNAVMDREADVFHHTHGKPPQNNYTNIFGQSDGGCRYKGASATG